jgi:hypothetical protein
MFLWWGFSEDTNWYGIRFFGPCVSGLLLCTAACGGGKPDSAGGPTEWFISPDPVVVIGREGDPRYEFDRVVGIASLGDGRLVVADGGSQELRIYTASGDFSHHFGGRGNGPGEFTSITGIRVRAGSILVTEGRFGPARFYVFDPDHGLQRQESLRSSGTSTGYTPMAIISTMALVVAPGTGPRVMTPPPGGLVMRDSVTLGIFRLGDRPAVKWIGEFPSVSWFSYAMPPGSRMERGLAVTRLGPSLVLGSAAQKAWIGDSGTGIISLFDTNGVHIVDIQFPHPARPFDQAALHKARSQELARVPEPDRLGLRASIETMYSSNVRPAAAPYFTKFTSGIVGEMWVELFSEVPNGEHAALVIDSTGRAIARATIPTGLTLYTVDRDRIIGVQTGHDDVELIAMHRLVR